MFGNDKVRHLTREDGWIKAGVNLSRAYADRLMQDKAKGAAFVRERETVRRPSQRQGRGCGWNGELL